MVLTVAKDTSLDNDYVDIKYRELNPTINQLIELCNNKSGWLLGEDDGQIYNIDINDVFYIEWVDNKCCICTNNKIFISAISLVRMEELLSEHSFIRVNKAILVNVYKVRWISSAINMKLVAELLNGEHVIISRRYRGDLLDAIYAIAKGKKK